MLLLGCLVIGLASFVHAGPNVGVSGFCKENGVAIYSLKEDLAGCDVLLINRRYERHPKDVLLDTKFLENLPASIVSVDLVDNNITELSFGDFNNFRNFRNFALAKNKIKQLKTGTLVNCAALDLITFASNEIETIEPGFFDDLPNLSTLDLSNNKITHLEEGVFKGLVQIFWIKLERNKLSAIQTNIFTTLPQRLAYLSCSENNFKVPTPIFGKTCEKTSCYVDLCVNDICRTTICYL